MNESILSKAVVWHPPADVVAGSRLRAFMDGHGITDFDALSARADADPEWFWRSILDGIRFIRPYERLLDTGRGVPFARWCVGATTNVVLNCIECHRDTSIWKRDCIVFEAEDGRIRRWTYEELARQVETLAAGLRRAGCGRGQVVGLYLPNLPEAIASFLAVARIGAVALPLFSGFGAAALSSRLADAGASTVITADGSWRRGTLIPMKTVVDEAAGSLPALERVVVVRHAGNEVPMQAGRDHWLDALVDGAPPVPIEEMDAEAPLMLMYTSGTTGRPKGTVHSHCGFVAKLALDMGLMLDVGPQDRMFWLSDMGWLVGPMMAVGATHLGATMLLVEGGPDYPDAGRMWRLVDEHRISFLGLAPTMIRGFIKQGGAGVEERALSTLRVVASTGEAWTPEAWWWTFEKVCRGRVPILNYSGGTEIGGAILSGTVLHPMKPCAFTAVVPGMQADVVDEEGRPVPRGTVGELVLRGPSIGLTRSLWQDDARYLDSYWKAIPGLWRHGDWACADEDGFWFVLGRSDDTLKIAGKRTGPSEIEGLLTGTGKVAEAAAIGLPDPVKGQAVGCLVTLMPGLAWSDTVKRELENAVVAGLGAPYRPRFILAVSELPKTRNMKVMRRVARAACLGETAGDLSSLVNPSSVDEIKALAAAVAL